MTLKATTTAHPNIAFIKYWGKKKGLEDLRIPVNSSISMPIKQLTTTTTVEFSSQFKENTFILDGKVQSGKKLQKVTDHVERFKMSSRASAKDLVNKGISPASDAAEMTATDYKFKVTSTNNFPTGAGIASSASGFAALTLALNKTFSLQLSEKQLSIMARIGSGSACRSIPEGWVEWIAGNSNETSYAKTIFPADWWDIADIVVTFDKTEKKVSSSEAMKFASTSPFFETRQKKIKDKISKLKTIIKTKNFREFGKLIEQEAIELHTIIMTQNPSIIYWSDKTIQTIHQVGQWREQGLPVYFTIDAGSNIHLIVEQKNKKDAQEIIRKIRYIINVL